MDRYYQGRTRFLLLFPEVKPSESSPLVEGSGQGEAMKRGRGLGTWQCTFGVIGGKSPIHVLRPAPAVARRDRGRRALEVADTRDPLAAWRAPGCFGPKATTTRRRMASGTGVDIDAVPTVPVTTAAVLHEDDSWRRRRRPQSSRRVSDG